MSCCTLRKAPTGQKFRVRSLCSCPRDRGRLCALGITPGTEIEVCSQAGACCVKVRDTSLVIGDAIAEDVLCEPVPAVDEGVKPVSEA